MEFLPSSLRTLFSLRYSDIFPSFRRFSISAHSVSFGSQRPDEEDSHCFAGNCTDEGVLMVTFPALLG